MSSHSGYLREIAELQDRLKQANKKWQDYELEYILPCFKLAEDAGIDLRALVSERRGNCVVLLVRELIDQRDAARSRLTRALPEHKIVTDFLSELRASIERTGFPPVRNYGPSEWPDLLAFIDRLSSFSAPPQETK